MADGTLPPGAYEAADEAFESYRVGDEGPRDELEAALLAAAERIRADERERITGLFNAWIEILMSEPNAHPPSAWKEAFADLIKIGTEETS